MKYILSFSGGKDSTYLLLELIRRDYPLDEVRFFDTGWEYPAMYDHIEKCKKLCEEHGIEFVMIKPKESFEYMMFDKPVKRKDGKGVKIGYSWCGGTCRWGTALKRDTLNKIEDQDTIMYVGIAADEHARLKKTRPPNQRFPLVEWGITEAQCLKGCYDAGFDWGGLYEHLPRVSCMFCTNNSLKLLRNLYKHYPDVWEKLKDYQRRTDRPYKGEGQSVFDLECRFEFEEERLKQGLSITNREFHRELRNKLSKNISGEEYEC